VQAKLGFTYDVHDMEVLEGDTWTDMMKRHLGADSPDATADVGLEYWLRSSERLESVSLLSGHIDGASVLIARVEPSPDMALFDQIIRFLKPYDWWLWLALIGMVLASGIVDYLLEVQSIDGAKLSDSIYEYAGGALWGGWETPRSTMSACFQVIISFIFLVTVSAYTANLAAFLTLSAADSSSVSSLRQLIYEDRAACVAYDSAMRQTYEVVYPQMRKDLSHSQWDILDALADKRCDAVVMARDLYDINKMSTKYCHLAVVETLFPSRLGWAVHRLSPCVKESFEWALDELWNSGKVALLFQKWFQTASCAGVQPGDEEQDARRKLRPGEPRRFIPGQHRHRNRQLSTSNDSSTELSAEEEAAIEAEIAAQSDVWSSSGVKLMLVSDFAGIFLLWAATATCMLLVAAFHYSKKQRGELAAKTKHKIRQATRGTSRNRKHRDPNCAQASSELAIMPREAPDHATCSPLSASPKICATNVAVGLVPQAPADMDA